MSKTLLTARTGVRRGKIELAHGGTIFFRRDRRCLSGTSTQALALPPGTGVRARGGVTPISVDVRIIAATNRNLERSIKEGLFRADLYYRLNVVAISLPPLRERREDIAPLSQYFLRKDAAAIRRNVAGIAEEGQRKLEAYEWPGNVRELANVIERAVVLGWDSTITLEDLPNGMAAARTTAGTEMLSYREGVNSARKQLVMKALSITKGNRSAAAKLLGLESKYLLKLMKSLRLE